jgi:regulator of sigma E protease
MIGGPLFIAQQSGREARQGASNLFFFMALLSVNLAVLNVLPIPILDGGHLLFLALEKIKGSPLSTRARMIAQQVGLVVLLGVIILVTYNDILRVIRGY